MRVIVGRVVIAETGVGVSGVVVVAFGSQAASPGASTPGGVPRIGSVLTDETGAFRIEYGIDGPTAPTGVRVAVFADAATTDISHALYAEATPRNPAAALESYAIRVPQDQLLKNALPAPVQVNDPSLRLGAQYALRVQLGAATNTLISGAGRPIIDVARAPLAQLGDQVRADLRVRGRAFPGSAGGTVQTRLLDAIKRSITNRFASANRRVLLQAAASEQAKLKVGTQLTEGDATPFVFGASSLTQRQYNSLLTPACRDARLPDSKCPEAGSNGGSGGGNGTPPPTPTIEDLVWRALSTSPGLNESRPAPTDVARRVSGLQLASGPADVTALHDFDVLHLAFENVWDDLVDEQVVDAATRLHQAVLRAGGSPPGSQSGTIAFSLGGTLDGLLSEARALVTTLLDTVSSFLSPVRSRGAVDQRSNGGGVFAGGPTVDRNGHPITPGVPPQQQDNVDNHRVPDPASDVQALLAELEKLLAEPYRFTVFAADNTGVAINFGLIVTYRQRWQPVTYQAGKLVSTITLAPREERSYSRKTTVTTRKKQDTSEKFRSLNKTEEDITDRAVRDIVQSAQSSTGLDVTYSGEAVSVTLSHNDQQSSSDTKQSFREAVRRASAEYESQRSVQVSFETTVETTTEEMGKIVNPNAELAVTYLFYQLQRRFLVSERIQKLTPVVMVAQPVPKPSDLTIKWLLQYDWILRRAILDPSFIGAFDYVTQDLVGEEFTLAVLKQNVDAQQKVVSELKDNLAAARNDLTSRYQALQSALAMAPTSGGDLSWLFGLAAKLLGPDSNADAQNVQLREQIARDAYDRAVDAERSLEDQLAKEASLLTVMTDKWVEAQKGFFNKTVEVDRLRLHIKQNILYYMQAIWDHEPPDQRYFRLHQVPVPVLAGSLSYTVVEDETTIPMPPTWTKPTVLQAQASITTDGTTVPLVEIADLDNPLGYKGNYMIFPLVEPNVLTKFMMVPYANRASGIQDPDQPGNLTRAELDQYVCCLKKNLAAADLNALLPGINEAYQWLLSDPNPSEEEIIVPTDSLYIEALPAAQPVLEDYQLLHRAADVERVRISNAGKNLDNVRHGARILGGDLTSDFDKSILVEGAKGVTVEDGEK